MLSKLKDKSRLFLASSLCDGLEDNNINHVTILLLSKGADPNVIVPIHGLSPFHLVIGNSSEKFSEEVTKLFLQYGGNPNVKSINGMTPVHVASALGRINILKLLLDAGGDPLAVDDDQKTPFDYAFDASYYGAIALLSKYYPSVKMFGGNTQETGEDNGLDADEDEEDKSDLQDNAIEIKLEKILVNKGDFVAEYVPSEIDATFEKTDTTSTKQLNDNYTSQLLSDSQELNFTRDFDESHTSHYHSFNTNLNKLLLHDQREEKENKYCHFMGNITNNNINTNEFHKIKSKLSTNPLVFNTSIVSKSPNFNIVDIKKEGKAINCNKNKGNELEITPDMEKSALIGDDKYNNYASPITTRVRKKWWAAKKLKYEETNDTFSQNDLNSKNLSRISCDDFDETNKTPNNLTFEILRDEKILGSSAATSGHEFFSSPDSISPKNHSEIKQNFNDTEVLRELSLCEDRGPTPPASVSWNPIEDDSLNYLLTEDSTLISNETRESKTHPQSDFNHLQSSFGSPNAETTFYSVDEEYAYVDSVKNVAFLERRLRVLSPGLDVDEMDMAKTETSWIKKLEELSLESSRNEIQTSSCFDGLSIDNVTLRQRLTALGQAPGPITSTTYRVYLKRLCKLERKGVKKPEECLQATGGNKEQKKNSVSAIPLRLLSTDWTEKYKFYRDLEDKAFHEFQQPQLNRKYRGGNAKVSFNYLLLDPRITNDLPRNGRLLSLEERWKIFLEGIFYIGKGKSARSAAHLYDAFDYWMGKKNNNTAKEASKKIKRILDIWRDKKGVVCLHVFVNTMQEEAFTREAAMIDALGTNCLSNCNRGNYYGVMTTMSSQDKKSLGKFLLYKAMEIFMHEGERQLFPKNVE